MVIELRCHMPNGQKTKTLKKKKYCNKINKDFKNGPHQEKKKNITGFCLASFYFPQHPAQEFV